MKARPVLSVIEGTGFHPSLFRCAGMMVTDNKFYSSRDSVRTCSF